MIVETLLLLLLGGEWGQTTRQYGLLLLAHAVRTGTRLRHEQLLLRLLTSVQRHAALLHEIVLV